MLLATKKNHKVKKKSVLITLIWQYFEKISCPIYVLYAVTYLSTNIFPFDDNEDVLIKYTKSRHHVLCVIIFHIHIIHTYFFSDMLLHI